MVAQHDRDVEVFQCEPVVGVDQLVGNLMQRVLAGGPDVGVRPGEPGDCLTPVVRSLLGAAEPPAEPAQGAQPSGERLRGGDAGRLDPVRAGGDEQVGQPAVDPDPAAAVVRRAGRARP